MMIIQFLLMLCYWLRWEWRRLQQIQRKTFHGREFSKWERMCSIKHAIQLIWRTNGGGTTLATSGTITLCSNIGLSLKRVYFQNKARVSLGPDIWEPVVFWLNILSFGFNFVTHPRSCSSKFVEYELSSI